MTNQDREVQKVFLETGVTRDRPPRSPSRMCCPRDCPHRRAPRVSAVSTATRETAATRGRRAPTDRAATLAVRADRGSRATLVTTGSAASRARWAAKGHPAPRDRRARRGTPEHQGWTATREVGETLAARDPPECRVPKGRRACTTPPWTKRGWTASSDHRDPSVHSASGGCQVCRDVKGKWDSSVLLENQVLQASRGWLERKAPQ